MIPLDVADPQALEAAGIELRRAGAEAVDRLWRAEALEQAAAELPPEATTLGTLRLLAQQRRLAERRVALYRQALTVVEEGLRAR